MGGSSGGSTTTVQKADPWSGAQPYLKDIMGQAQNVYNQSANNQYYPYSTVVPFSNATNQGLNAITQRATNGSPLIGSAQDELQKTISGGYLDPTQNPAYQTMMDSVTNQVNSQFGAAGRTGSGMNQEALARGITQGGSQLYDQERQRQIQGMLFAPQMANQDYYDATQLLGVGQQQEGLAGNYINDAMNRYNFNQQQPWQNLQNYSGIVGGFGSQGESSSSTQSQSAPKGNAIGGMAGGAMAGSMFGPWGTAIGAGLGLLGSL